MENKVNLQETVTENIHLASDTDGEDMAAEPSSTEYEVYEENSEDDDTDEDSEDDEEFVVDPRDVKGRFLTFWIEKQLYGMPIVDVEQIVGVQRITPVPSYPYYARGIINLRGMNIPVVDVRLRFGKEQIQYTDRTCIIINKIGELYIGFIVDAVEEVAIIEDEQILAPPLTPEQMVSSYLTGIVRDTNNILLVDIYKMFDTGELSTLSHHA